VDALAKRILPTSTGPMLSIAAVAGLGAVLSALMNNVGAMVLLMPLAIQVAARHGLPPGKVLMPLAFSTILGGMTTLIGTPPNLIVSAFRADAGLGSFGMFDFTPVGITVAGLGVVFIALIGWRIVPARERNGPEGFDTAAYLTEARVTKDSKAAGKTLREIEEILDRTDAQVVGMVRNEFRVSAPNPWRRLRPGDILVIEAEPKSLASALSDVGLKLEESMPQDSPEAQDAEGLGLSRPPDSEARDRSKDETHRNKEREPAETILQELVATPGSSLIGRSASDVQIRTRFGLNLLAISRQGRRSVKRLRSTAIHVGDVLLMQGPPDSLSEFASEFGCLPLAARSIRIPDKKRAAIATGVMVMAIAGAAFGLLPAATSFATGVLIFMALRVVPLRKVYEAIDWPVVVLLGALIPVAGAAASTGAANMLAGLLLDDIAQGHPIAALVLILVATMTLSDLINNAATAAMMCPIAISEAEQLGDSADSFLMAVAIGASCAFLTPIGHQNNTLILGPGGFRFGDYWRLGLPMEILVVVAAVPLLLLVWPL
jgi:di/tricarboxylate transporter